MNRHNLKLLPLLTAVLLLTLGLAACEPAQVEPVPTLAPAAETPTEMLAEIATEEPTEAPTEAPTETPTEIPTETPTEAPTETPTQEVAFTNAVTVEDQALGEDNTVTVASVTSAGPGWIVIHADADGAPGPVIGHAAVQEGENQNVEVEIDPAMATETLYAMLHVDAGAVGEYEFPGDDVPATNDAGNVVTPAFELSGIEAGAEMTVTVADSAFEPPELTVPVGTTITWVHEGRLTHTVTADDASFNSGNLRTGDTFTFTFSEAGTYPYYCRFHGAPGGIGMAGTIIVTDNS
ncbi:MAG TPA: cupredoxin domain-containing protein [Anaerolineae bacterium]